MGMKRTCLLGVALACSFSILQGGSCQIGTMGDGTQLWLHDGVTLAGDAQVLEARTVVEGKPTSSKILESSVGNGIAKALVGAGGQVGRGRARRPSRGGNDIVNVEAIGIIDPDDDDEDSDDSKSCDDDSY